MKRERELLSLVAVGDESAFTVLFHQWRPLLASYIYRITNSKVLTEEIVQDVFLKIWMTRETLEEISNFKAYLFIVSRNHAINALKQALREVNKQNVYQKEMMVAGDMEEDEENSKIFLTLIDEAIAKLPPRQKEVYFLHRHQQFTYLEIANKLGIGKESVKTHLQLASRFISDFVRNRIGIMISLLECQDIFF